MRSSGVAMPQARRNSSNYTIPRTKKKQKGPAKNGECKFDGSDYPEWLGFDPKEPGAPFTNAFPTIDGDPWEKTMQMIKDHDDDVCEQWDGEVQNLLVFSGLFSAVVTAFAVETQKLLEPDPEKASVLILAQLVAQLSSNTTIADSIAEPFREPNSPSQTFRVNALIFTSLVLALGTALVGIIALQWIRSYRSSESASDRERISLRQIRYAALVKWKVPTIISYLPILLGTALMIFFAGLIDFLVTMDSNVAIVVGVLVAIVGFFLVVTTILPTLHIYLTPDPMPPCPYQSPQSWLCYKFFDGIFLWGRKRTSYCKNWTELILDLHKKSIDLDPGKKDMWLKNSLVWIFTKFNSSQSFRLAYHCLQSIHNMNVGWDVVYEVLPDRSDLKNTGKEIWKEIQLALAPTACTEFLSTLLLLWNCPLGAKYSLHRSELFYRCIHTFSQFNTDNEIWPEYTKLIQLWWGKTGFASLVGASSNLEDRKAYLATFLTALESNPAVGQEKLTFNLFWKYLSLRVQDEDAVPTVLDCLRILTHWFLRVKQLSPDEYHLWYTNRVLRYSLQPMFDYNVFNLNFVTPELYNHPTFFAFMDIFIDSTNDRLAEGWEDAIHSGLAEKWDDFLLESRIDRKYWALSSNIKKLEKQHEILRTSRGRDNMLVGELTRRRPTFPPPHPILPESTRPLHPDQARQHDGHSITTIQEDYNGTSLATHTNFYHNAHGSSSAIPLTTMSRAPATASSTRPPNLHAIHTADPVHLLQHTSTSPTSAILPPDDDRGPFYTTSPRTSLESSLTSQGQSGTVLPR